MKQHAHGSPENVVVDVRRKPCQTPSPSQKTSLASGETHVLPKNVGSHKTTNMRPTSTNCAIFMTTSGGETIIQPRDTEDDTTTTRCQHRSTYTYREVHQHNQPTYKEVNQHHKGDTHTQKQCWGTRKQY